MQDLITSWEIRYANAAAICSCFQFDKAGNGNDEGLDLFMRSSYSIWHWWGWNEAVELWRLLPNTSHNEYKDRATLYQSYSFQGFVKILNVWQFFTPTTLQPTHSIVCIFYPLCKEERRYKLIQHLPLFFILVCAWGEPWTFVRFLNC